MKEFLALFTKNAKIWSRSGCGCCCEIFTTLLFAMLLFTIGRNINEASKPATSYLDKMTRIGPDNSLTADPPAIPNLNFPNNYIAQLEFMKKSLPNTTLFK